MHPVPQQYIVQAAGEPAGLEKSGHGCLASISLVAQRRLNPTVIVG